MTIRKIEKVEMFYITTEDYVKYKRIPGKTLDEDEWYIVITEGEFRITSRSRAKELSQVYLKYVEDLFDASPCF